MDERGMPRWQESLAMLTDGMLFMPTHITPGLYQVTLGNAKGAYHGSMVVE